MKPAKLLRRDCSSRGCSPFALGCKGGGSGAPATVSDFCTQYADAICQIRPPLRRHHAGHLHRLPEGRLHDPGDPCHRRRQADLHAGQHRRLHQQGEVRLRRTTPIRRRRRPSIDLACSYVFQGKGVRSTDTCTTQFDCAGATNGTIICDAAQTLCATIDDRLGNRRAASPARSARPTSTALTNTQRLALHRGGDQHRCQGLHRRPLRQQLALRERHLHAAGQRGRRLHRGQRLRLGRLLQPVRNLARCTRGSLSPTLALLHVRGSGDELPGRSAPNLGRQRGGQHRDGRRAGTGEPGARPALRAPQVMARPASAARPVLRRRRGVPARRAGGAATGDQTGAAGAGGA